MLNWKASDNYIRFDQISATIPWENLEDILR